MTKTSRGGRRGAVTAVARKALERIYLRGEDLLFTGTLTAEPLVRGQVTLSLRDITAADAEAVLAFTETYRTAEDARHVRCYLREGFHGLIAERDGVLLGLLWWVEGDEESLPHLGRRRLGLNDKDVYAFDFFVAPPFRGGKTAVHFLTALELELYARGYERLWGSVLDGNLRAVRLYTGTGHTLVSKTTSRRFLTTFVVADGQLLIRNTRWSRFPFDYRPLVTFRRRATRA